MISLVYILTGTYCDAISGPCTKSIHRHTLMIITEGRGKVHSMDKQTEVMPGNCFLFHPGMEVQLESLSDLPLQVYSVEFEPLPVPVQGTPRVAALAQGQVYPEHVSRMIQLVHLLHPVEDLCDEKENYSKHVLFQELILLVMKADTMDKEHRSIQAVDTLLQRLEQSVTLDYTLDQLAAETGLSTRHFSRLFREHTGQSPIQYLNALRMNRAKKRLLESNDSIQEIAGHIGFRDPFHFSRSFKQYTGVSPRLYIHLRKHTMRVASFQFLGELLALGITPIGAPYQLLDCRYYQGHVRGVPSIGNSVVTPYLDKISELKPDLIVTFNGHHYAEYSKIAPTLDVPWSLPFFERFRLIADLTGRTSVAEAWMESYMNKIKETQRVLSPLQDGDQTVSFFWMRGLPATFQVYYDVGVLYRDLQLKPPAPVLAAQQNKSHPFKEDIPLDQLHKYAGDHLFIVVSGDPESIRQFEQLERSKYWQQLPAVQNGQVYRMTEDWLREDPISMMGQVQDLMNLIG
ncbi:helix-turn-helix domain-containing protein [Paenibacillus taichungensis]|uniref:helix-turn-helix domain-containing protein n=1 Tax=Paenibacillus taichungensis TaxID=484184 RepID=UPI00381B1314